MRVDSLTVPPIPWECTIALMQRMLVSDVEVSLYTIYNINKKYDVSSFNFIYLDFFLFLSLL